MSPIKTKTQILIDAIRKHEKPIRSTELAQITGIERNSITALLAGAVERGDVTTCKVFVPGKQETNEYRIGCGVPAMPIPAPLHSGKPVHFARRTVSNGTPPAPRPAPKSIIKEFDGDELKPTRRASPKHTQPAVVKNSGSAALAPSLGSLPAKGRAVAKNPVPARLVDGPAGCDDFKIVIDQDGAVSCYDSTGFTVDFTPAQTLALGDFLHCCETLWRP